MALPLIPVTDPQGNLMQTQWKAQLDPLLAANNNATSSSNPPNAGSAAGSGTIPGLVGEVKAAFLTEKQFQAQAGTGWVLCDGRNVKSSSYYVLTGNVTIPDMRATVPRMKDNGRGLDPHGDLALGTYEADQFASHAHGVTDPGHTHSFNITGNTPEPTITLDGAANTGNYARLANGGAGSYGYLSINPATTGITIQDTGGSETNGKSTIINYFMRIN
jgi:hypothetical protein